jgi:tRNA threonylcarbamoyladenosine modification (KEOPS) complex  Pcc1 subunit
MDAKCIIEIEFDDERKVKTVLKSIQVDDFEFVKSEANGKILKATIKSNSVSSLLHTLDDYLSCISVAANVCG